MNTRNTVKVQTQTRNNEEFKDSYFDSSMVPKDYSRFTYMSKDNNFYFNGNLLILLLISVDEKEDILQKQAKSRNMSHLK